MTHPLTKYRKEHGLTLEGFANLVGSTKPQVWKWERGAFPRPEGLVKIQKATKGKITANDFMPQNEAVQ